MQEVIIVEIEIGKRIRELREERAINQVSLAKTAGISQSFFSDIERGRKSPTIRSLHKLAKALNISLQELISD